MINELFDFYIKHQKELVEKYNGKYLVITKDGVKGAYDSQKEGYAMGIREYGKGNFMLQLCTPGDSAYSQRFFTSRVTF